jgi:hypothetical protein
MNDDPMRRYYRRRTTLCLTLSLIVGVLAVATALAASAKTVSAGRGGTSATLTYESSSAAQGEPYSKLHLTIARRGRSVFDGPVDGLLCGTRCWPAVGIAGNPVVRVADLEPGGSPDVILNLYSGGAHCCSITQVYRYDPDTGRDALVQHDFADPGSLLRTLAGSYVFLSADDRFAYTFTSFAFSGLPLAIWRFAGGRFVDVTARFPAQLAADAERQYRAYLANRRQGLALGFIAAWAADEDLLGHSALVARTLAAQSRAGDLRSADGFAKRGDAFIAQLQRFLVMTGYAR